MGIDGLVLGIFSLLYGMGCMVDSAISRSPRGTRTVVFIRRCSRPQTLQLWLDGVSLRSRLVGDIHHSAFPLATAGDYRWRAVSWGEKTMQSSRVASAASDAGASRRRPPSPSTPGGLAYRCSQSAHQGAAGADRDGPDEGWTSKQAGADFGRVCCQLLDRIESSKGAPS